MRDPYGMIHAKYEKDRIKTVGEVAFFVKSLQTT